MKKNKSPSFITRQKMKLESNLSVCKMIKARGKMLLFFINNFVPARTTGYMHCNSVLNVIYH